MLYIVHTFTYTLTIHTDCCVYSYAHHIIIIIIIIWKEIMLHRVYVCVERMWIS